MTTPPLDGIRILDLSRVLAGPWAAQYLADLGCEVIKVERAGTGDDARAYGPPYVKDADGNDTSENFFHLSCNRGKKSLTVDIAQPEGQQIVKRLAGTCDVLVENFKVGNLAKYGLDYDSLHKEFPRLVYCSVTGFGQTGPYRLRPGYDAIFQGMSGLMSVTGIAEGEPGAGPMKVGPSITDIICGLNAVIAVVSALYARDVKGAPGQQLDLALFDTAVAAMSHYAQIYLSSGVAPFRRGTQGNGGVPSQMFYTKDGALMLTAGNSAQYCRLCEAIGRPEMARHPLYEDARTRIANRSGLSAWLQEHFLTDTTAHWLDALEKGGVPSGPIYDFEEVFADPHMVSRGLKVTVEHPFNPAVDLIGSPLRMSETPVATPKAPPLVGEHTTALLDELGYDALTQQDFRARGVI
ncbi:CaiB/BaiF CoA transferase family protein [Tropicimonas isoalkanivorans]|uniref:Crotonobetainyl-CoA:carnitine CoA-transferase CaiB n=1 Tax=Tropicimonas isoalkanivorans TaxID=441112 RepID=A0A1I1HV04_9RHOB|nr:CaiB/BaiF CoA-transferase family protein [Tropicimonas isoalkanivorans]SFC27726.1 Crotonobetainyl-CoA:carnitine CoA-transferase CaiB [Tropicimonas isoalkanivorans]